VANLSVSALRRRTVEAKALARMAFADQPSVPDLGEDDPEFWAAIRSLPKRQAQVLALYYLEDRPVAEVADILDMAPGTVKKQLYNGRQSLARRLRIEEDQP
jgi:RNA polymerase sigma-70 factor (ECF subfamily)